VSVLNSPDSSKDRSAYHSCDHETNLTATYSSPEHFETHFKTVGRPDCSSQHAHPYCREVSCIIIFFALFNSISLWLISPRLSLCFLQFPTFQATYRCEDQYSDGSSHPRTDTQT